MLSSHYQELPERFYERIMPERFPEASVILFNAKLAEDIGLGFANAQLIAPFVSGQKLLPGSHPVAQAYAGTQFGNFVPQLGDGRAHLLGDINGFDIQLKGSGRTRFSRQGDGRSALGPVIREFLVSEAMAALHIPTTRSLSIVRTEEDVFRQNGPEPGGILTRVAESHIRVGTFEYFACRDDREALAMLVAHVVQRHYPQIEENSQAKRCLRLLQLFAKRQGDLVAKWYGVGFIHGVMNTDNCSVVGITIDYGPCAFMDEFRFMKVFSSIDRQGRYAYGNQMAIAEWNIRRFAQCLLPLIDADEKRALERVDEVLNPILAQFSELFFQVFGRKLGFAKVSDDIKELVKIFLQYLEANSLDFTISFAHLEALYRGDTLVYKEGAELTAFLVMWKRLSPDLSLMGANNPKVVPRNHQIQHVIERAYDRDYEPMKELWEALKNPFLVPENYQYLTVPPKPSERVKQTFCGT